jgi:hypothetical protein
LTLGRTLTFRASGTYPAGHGRSFTLLPMKSLRTPASARHRAPLSVLEENLGLIEAPTRLYGRVWTGGPQVVIRYYVAQPLKGGDQVPICAVARLGMGQLRKRPESKPRTAILDSPRAGVYIVDEFR